MPLFTVDQEKCNRDGICAAACPLKIIDMKSGELPAPVPGAPDLCIHCCACVKICPNDARAMEDEKMSQITEWLYKNHSDRKEPEVFIN